MSPSRARTAAGSTSAAHRAHGRAASTNSRMRAVGSASDAGYTGTRPWVCRPADIPRPSDSCALTLICRGAPASTVPRSISVSPGWSMRARWRWLNHTASRRPVASDTDARTITRPRRRVGTTRILCSVTRIVASCPVTASAMVCAAP